MKAIKSALVSPWIGMIGILFTDSWKWKFYYKRNRLSSIYYNSFSDTYGHPLSNGAKNYPKEQITWELITSLILKHWKYMPVKWIHFHGQNLNSLEKSLLKYRKKLTSWEWRKFYKVCTLFNFNLIVTSFQNKSCKNIRRLGRASEILADFWPIFQLNEQFLQFRLVQARVESGHSKTLSRIPKPDPAFKNLQDPISSRRLELPKKSVKK